MSSQVRCDYCMYATHTTPTMRSGALNQADAATNDVMSNEIAGTAHDRRLMSFENYDEFGKEIQFGFCVVELILFYCRY